MRYAIKHSGCDSKAVQLFKHSGGGGYKFEGDYEAYMTELQSNADMNVIPVEETRQRVALLAPSVAPSAAPFIVPSASSE